MENNIVNIDKAEYEELLKIKKKYDALLDKHLMFLSNNNIYCRLCNSLSKHNGNIKNHNFKYDL